MKNLLVIFMALSSPIYFAQNIVLEAFASGFISPVEIVHANDTRLFVVQQNGLIKIVQPNGTVNAANLSI